MPTPWGYATILKVTLGGLMLSGATALFPGPLFLLGTLVSITLILFTLYFFRDPERTPPNEGKTVLAPADGRVMLVRKYEHGFTGPSSTLVSIFMSPFDVHVNRIPVEGTVTHLAYRPGKFMMAFDHRSLESNEKMEIGIENNEIKVHVSQVSGFLARRIVCQLQHGQQVEKGKRFGMIRFGSRVDIVVPAHATLSLRPGQRTKAGESVIARY